MEKNTFRYNPTIIKTSGVPDAKIVNVVAQYTFAYQDKMKDLYPLELNIEKLAKYMRCIALKYNPQNFAAAPIKIFSKRTDSKVTTCLLFSSGNVIHTGGETEAELKNDADELNLILIKKLQTPIVIVNFRITNIVCKMKADFNINIYGLYNHLGNDRAKYVPKGKNAFPAVRIKGLSGQNDSCLVFVSGALIFSGARDRSVAEKNHKIVYELCKPFQDKEITRLTPQEYGNLGRRDALKTFEENISTFSKKRRREEEEELKALDHKDPLKNPLVLQNLRNMFLTYCFDGEEESIQSDRQVENNTITKRNESEFMNHEINEIVTDDILDFINQQQSQIK